jgi:hypothetical protein
MGIISTLFGGKKNDEDRMRRAAQGQSVVGNVLGSSPYMKEWSRQKRHVLEDYEKRERSLRKQWRHEDEDISRSLGKMQGKYERKMGPEKGQKYYGEYEREQQRKIQRERDRVLQELEREKNEDIRNIQKNIKQWK